MSLFGGTIVNAAMTKYVGDDFVVESAEQRALRTETLTLRKAKWALAVDVANFLGWTVRLLDARHIIEVGTFTGYSAMTMAQAMASDGRIITCDISEEFTSVARRHWELARLSDKIELRIGPAKDTLDGLLAEGRSGGFDLAFIDADKSSYDAYYERCLQLIRPNGLILFDNMLWGGRVGNKPKSMDADTAALHALNQKVRTDKRVDASLLSIADGLLMLRKKQATP